MALETIHTLELHIMELESGVYQLLVDELMHASTKVGPILHLPPPL